MAQQSDAFDAKIVLGHNATGADKLSSQVQSQELIFINQYSEDSNRAKHGPGRRTIGSYVQRNIHRAKREKLQFRGRSRLQLGADSSPLSLPQDQNTSAEPNPVPVEFLSKFQVCGPPNDKDFSGIAKIRLQKNQDRSNETTQDISGSQLRMETSHRQNTRFQSRANSPRTYLDTGLISSLNDFEVFRISSPASTKLSFIYFLENIVPKIFPILSMAKEHRHWMFQATIANPELLFASSAVSAASSLAAVKNSDTNVPSLMGAERSKHSAAAFDAIWYKAQAVRLLNTRLANPDSVQSDTVPYAIMCVLLAAIISGDQNEMVTHANGLRRLIEIRGTYIGLPMHVISAVVSSFYISSAIGGSTPISPPQTLVETEEAQAVISAAFEAYPSLRETGCDLIDKEITAYLDWKLVKAFEEMREYVIVREYFQRSQQAPSASQAGYYHSKCLHCHFLLAHGPGPDGLIPTDRQEPCRLALLIFWNANTRLHGPESMLYRTLASQLKSALEIADLQTFWQEFFPVLMWIFLLGAFISSDRTERPWFLANIAEGMRSSGRTEWVWMRTALLRLLYLDSIYGEGFQRIWEEASALTVLPGAEKGRASHQI